MKSEKLDRRPIVAAVVASFVMLVFGATYYAIGARLEGPMTAIPPDSLKRLPLQIADWAGQDIPMDEAIVRATGTDASINRRYSRKGGQESISLFVGYGVNTPERIIHPPENCYVHTGWTLKARRSQEFLLRDGTKLPCSVFEFCRGELLLERVTVLHYYIVDGQYYRDVSLHYSKLRRLVGMAGYMARVLIVASNNIAIVDSGEKSVSAFAIDSAISIAHLFDDGEKARSPSPRGVP